MTKLPQYNRKIVNHYSSNDFDAQFAARAAALYEYFNYEVKNKQLQDIDVTGEGSWIKVHMDQKRYSKLSAPSKKQFLNALNKHLYPTKSYRWGQFKYYAALGRRTVGANKQWGGQGGYRILKFHLF